MIKLSKLTDYAIVVMGCFATNPSVMLSAQQLTEQTGIPHTTVSKVLKSLLKSGLLSSTQGTRGGYHLNKLPHIISVADIITAIDGPIYLADCTHHGENECNYAAKCPVQYGVQKVNISIQHVLQQMTLAEITAPHLSAQPTEVSHYE